MIKILLFQVMNLKDRTFLPFSVPVLLSRIHNQNPAGTVFLFFQPVQQFSKFSAGTIGRNDYINCRSAIIFFLMRHPQHSLSEKRTILSNRWSSFLLFIFL